LRRAFRRCYVTVTIVPLLLLPLLLLPALYTLTGCVAVLRLLLFVTLYVVCCVVVVAVSFTVYVAFTTLLPSLPFVLHRYPVRCLRCVTFTFCWLLFTRWLLHFYVVLRFLFVTFVVTLCSFMLVLLRYVYTLRCYVCVLPLLHAFRLRCYAFPIFLDSYTLRLLPFRFVVDVTTRCCHVYVIFTDLFIYVAFSLRLLLRYVDLYVSPHVYPPFTFTFVVTLIIRTHVALRLIYVFVVLLRLRFVYVTVPFHVLYVRYTTVHSLVSHVPHVFTHTLRFTLHCTLICVALLFFAFIPCVTHLHTFTFTFTVRSVSVFVVTFLLRYTFPTFTILRSHSI